MNYVKSVLTSTLASELGELSRILVLMHGNDFRFKRVSANQSDFAYNLIREGKDPENVVDFAVVRYANAAHVRQFEANIFIASAAIRSLIDGAINAIEINNLISTLIIMRCLIERFSQVHYLLNTTKKILNQPTVEDSHPFVNSMEITEVVRNTLYGTTVNWNEIVGKSLDKIDTKHDLGKGIKEEKTIHYATQILNKVDMLNKKKAGTRAAYEILCDFLHPNIGDLYCFTTEYSETKDRFGVKHITRVLSNSPISNPAKNHLTADQSIVEKIYEFFPELIKGCREDFAEADKFGKNLVQSLQSYTKKVIKSEKKFFSKSDLCPCESGEKIFKCCGKGMIIP